jgi:hypothetical protein
LKQKLIRVLFREELKLAAPQRHQEAERRLLVLHVHLCPRSQFKHAAVGEAEPGSFLWVCNDAGRPVDGDDCVVVKRRPS